MPGKDMATTRTRGPLFDGTQARLLAEARHELDQELGDETVDRIQQRLDVVLKEPTGFYRSNIKARPQGERVFVTDSDVVYGPWLEGVSRRNARSRFKGYRTFRKVFQEMEQEAPEIGESVVGRYVK